MAWFTRGEAKPFLEPALEDWHVQAWRWLLAHIGGPDGLRGFALVLPTRDFFPPTEAVGHARVAHVFASVQRIAGVADLSCDLIVQPPHPELRVGEMVSLQRDASVAAGTFGLEGNSAAITYDPALANDPMKLIAVLAHEVAHLRLLGFKQSLPGGRDANERATDLATVALGYGLFGANCAFNFERHHDPVLQGWQCARLGYLDEREWVFALSVWLALTARDGGAAKRYLKPHLYADLRAATARLARRPSVLHRIQA